MEAGAGAGEDLDTPGSGQNPLETSTKVPEEAVLLYEAVDEAEVVNSPGLGGCPRYYPQNRDLPNPPRDLEWNMTGPEI